jgi:YVTN family beta-propeller protein
MTINANSGWIPLKPPVRLTLLVLIFATGALLLLLSGPGALGAHVSPTVIATVPVGVYPGDVGVNAATDRVYVANTGSNNVSVIDGATNAVVATVPVGNAPYGIGVNAATDRVYVANQTSNNVSVIDGAINAVVATVPVGNHPWGVGVNAATDRVYVTNQNSNSVSVIDGAINAVVATVPVGSGPYGIGVNAATDRVYVANGGSNNVSVIDGAINTVVATVPVGPVGNAPVGVGVNAATDRVYVTNQNNNSVSVIDGAANAVVATVPVGNAPQGVGVNAATDRVYVANTGSNNVSVIDGVANAVVATVPAGNTPVGVGVNAATDRVYVANFIGSNVSVIGDAATATPTPTPTPFHPTFTQACADPPAGMVAWWPLDEQAGANTVEDIAPPPASTVDDVGFPKPGPLVGNPTGPIPVAGEVGGAMNFFGGSYLEVPVSTGADLDLSKGAGDFSIDAWVSLIFPVPFGAFPIVDKFDASSNTGFVFGYSGSDLYLNINGTVYYSDPLFLFGPWVHVAVTVQQGPAKGIFYIDGVPAGTFVPSGKVTNPNLPLWIGASREPFLNWHFAIDELEIFDTAVPQAGITEINDAGTVGKCRGPVGGVAALTVSSSGSPVPWTPLAALAASVTAVMGAGLWYGRRRWLR